MSGYLEKGIQIPMARGQSTKLSGFTGKGLELGVGVSGLGVRFIVGGQTWAKLGLGL